MTSRLRRFPIGLTLAAAVVFIICMGLGVWQTQRLHWKLGVLARIAAVEKAPVQPALPVLARAGQGQNVEFTRVEVDCAGGPPGIANQVMAVQNGEYAWRALSACRIDAPPFDGLVVDRGVVDATRGRPSGTPLVLPAPQHLIGVLRQSAIGPEERALGLAYPAPLVLVTEKETPAAPGITPAPPLTGDAPASLQYVGEYAPTWFGLAGVLACFYAAMLWRRYHPK